MCPTSLPPPTPPPSSNTLITTLKTRPEATVFCTNAFRYHPELPGGLVQTTTLRENPTPGGA